MAGGGDSDEDKNHEPTQRKLEEAAKNGDVPRSVEINTMFVLGGLVLTLLVGSGYISTQIMTTMRGFLGSADQLPTTAQGFLSAGTKAALGGLSALALPLGIGLLAALAGAMVQHKPLWTSKPLAPQFSRISPMAGIKRIVGKEGLMQFVKGLLKIGIVGALGTAILWGEHDRLEPLARMELPALLPVTQELAVKMLAGMVALFALVAIGDYVFQRFTWMKRHRMSARELKEEFKESEGNPEIKAKLRQIRASKVRKRMMQAVPEAAVIITNPTHFAVALKYEPGMQVPICVAKGVDSLALRIRVMAAEHDIPIIENPPLARALHAVVDIDDEIPVEHFKAVAEIIGYVLRLRRRTT